MDVCVRSMNILLIIKNIDHGIKRREKWMGFGLVWPTDDSIATVLKFSEKKTWQTYGKNSTFDNNINFENISTSTKIGCE